MCEYACNIDVIVLCRIDVKVLYTRRESKGKLKVRQEPVWKEAVGFSHAVCKKERERI